MIALFASVALHIALSAQVGQFTAKSVDWQWKQLYTCAYLSDGEKECSHFSPVPPPEHVIEIRTRREPTFILEWKGHCPRNYEYDFSSRPAFPRCQRVTKTLYIDGTKIGTIKETEER